jgi:beta-glucosidase-like glycosyl hydrolase
MVLGAVPAPADIPMVPQDPDPAYTKVIEERAGKIAQTLGIDDAVKRRQVQDIIAEQYRNLGMVQDACDEQIKAIQGRSDIEEETKKFSIQTLKETSQTLRQRLHTRYLVRLSALLTPAQIEKVKDGMTYGLVQVTYNSYLEMLPELTEEQKGVIRAYLVEAREMAMDASSSNEKHQWFGKYKGRINNYLSSQGYDLKKASEARNSRRQSQN